MKVFIGIYESLFDFNQRLNEYENFKISIIIQKQRYTAIQKFQPQLIDL